MSGKFNSLHFLLGISQDDYLFVGQLHPVAFWAGTVIVLYVFAGELRNVALAIGSLSGQLAIIGRHYWTLV